MGCVLRWSGRCIGAVYPMRKREGRTVILIIHHHSSSTSLPRSTRPPPLRPRCKEGESRFVLFSSLLSISHQSVFNHPVLLFTSSTFSWSSPPLHNHHGIV